MFTRRQKQQNEQQTRLSANVIVNLTLWYKFPCVRNVFQESKCRSRSQMEDQHFSKLVMDHGGIYVRFSGDVL